MLEDMNIIQTAFIFYFQIDSMVIQNSIEFYTIF